MGDTFVSCALRNEVGSNACHRVRSKGHIPAVIYGHHFSNYSIELDNKELNKVIREHGENALVNVMIEGITYPAMMKEIQRDPVTSEIIHMDLQQVYATEKIHATVPILLSGKEAIGRVGILQQQLKKVEVECFPGNVPKFFSVDVSSMGMGGAIKVADVEFGEEIAILSDMNEIIVSLSTIKEETLDEEEAPEEDE